MRLVLRNLTKDYQQGNETIHVLKRISLAVEPGQSLAILGHSGSGKTTLLSLIAGLDHPSRGEVLYDQKSLFQMGPEQITEFRSRHIGFVFQQFHLIPYLTALDNVALPLEIRQDPQARKKASQALKEVEMSQRASHFPHQMSGGECQRVAIARALITRPSLILADEPTGNLDDQTANQVIELFFRLIQENRSSLIMVTHNEVMAQRCQATKKLQEGQLWDRKT